MAWEVRRYCAIAQEDKYEGYTLYPGIHRTTQVGIKNFDYKYGENNY